MGYNLMIGEAYMHAEEPQDYDGQLVCRFQVKHEEHDEAPRDGSPTDGTNERWPSYTAWSEFCHETGLYELFYDKHEGLIREHPGCFLLTQKHLDAVMAVEMDGLDTYDRGRVRWLQYWIKWALENCKIPAIENS